MKLKIKKKDLKIELSMKDKILYGILITLITFGGKILHFILEMLKIC
jgi:hypothetical protein